MRRSCLLLIASLALMSGGGCVTNSTVTDGDREVNHQTLGAAVATLELLSSLGGIPGIPADVVAAAYAAVEQVKLNAEHLQGVHGAPQEPKPFSPENAKAARDKSTQEHADGGLLLKIGGTALTVLGIGLGFMRFGGPIAQALPWIGPKAAQVVAKAQKWLAGSTGKALDEAVATVAQGRQEGVFPASEIKRIADKVQSDGFSNTLLMEAAHLAEKKLFGAKLPTIPEPPKTS
jgi:hypothetical protein